MRGEGWAWRIGAAVVVVVLGTAVVPPAPAGAATEDVVAYVDAVHRLLVGRPASAGEVERWVPEVERDRWPALTGALAGSPAWAEQQVARLYRTHLLREPDAPALAHWSALITRGGEPREVEAHVLASPEHRYRHRALDPGALVELLYRTALGRNADAGGRAHWVGELEAGADPVAVAGALLSSPEGLRRQVDGRYRSLLGRPAKPAEQAGWGPHLARAGQAALDATLVASEERYARSTGTAPIVAATTNLAGWQLHAGDLAPAQAVVPIVAAAWPRPAAIGVVEVCASGDPGAPGQLELLAAELAPLGYSMVWAPSIEAFGRPGCAQYGNALAVRGTVRSSTSVDFEAQRLDPARDFDEVRNAVCAEAVVGGRALVACTTHLVNPLPTDVDTTRRQAAEALAFVTSAGPEGLRLVAGDLNLVPSDPELDGWYAALRPADPGGRTAPQPTTDGGAAVDHVFASPAPTSSATSLRTTVLPTSDHHWVAGTFRVR
ncbi:MAG: DUF4214 domain-containing protein [Acidimicrobiia bacterium]